MPISRAMAVIAGVLAGTLGALLKGRPGIEDSGLRRSVRHLERRLAEHERFCEGRFSALEERADEHEAKLRDVPSTAQIVSAMEDLLARTMEGLDSRLSTQARSLETLKTTVSQTDELLERVLESIDSLHSSKAEGDSNATGAAQSGSEVG